MVELKSRHARKKLRLIQKAWMTEQNKKEKHKLWQKFKTEQRSFILCTRKAKRRDIKERQIYLLMTKASNIKRFWKEFDSIGIHNDKRSSKELPTSILKEDGIMSSGSNETLMTWRNHFDTLLNLNSTESCYTATQPGDNCPALHDDALNRPIELEVQLVIAQLQENEAPAPDNICPSILKDDRVLRYLHKLFRRCFETGTVPLPYSMFSFMI